MVEQQQRQALQPRGEFKQTKTTTVTAGSGPRKVLAGATNRNANPSVNNNATPGQQSMGEEKRQSVISAASNGNNLVNAAATAVSSNQYNRLNAAANSNMLVPPAVMNAKEGSVQLQSTLRGLKDNYVVIEQQIEQETQKQRQGHQDRYAKALEKIHQLKKILKTEIEQRKNAEEHFRVLIEEKSEECLNQFTVSYLNKLHAMHETVQTFEKRKQALEGKRQDLRVKIETSMRQSREDIINNVQTKQQRFEQEYQKQVDVDVRDLKQIGELKHNYEQMTQQIATSRAGEFTQLKQLIVETIRDNDVYEREESVRKILIKQTNTLKDQLKLEMQNRQMADREIQEALNKYQLIIQEQVEKQRSQIKASKKPALAKNQSASEQQ